MFQGEVRDLAVVVVSMNANDLGVVLHCVETSIGSFPTNNRPVDLGRSMAGVDSMAGHVIEHESPRPKLLPGLFA